MQQPVSALPLSIGWREDHGGGNGWKLALQTEKYKDQGTSPCGGVSFSAWQEASCPATVPQKWLTVCNFFQVEIGVQCFCEVTNAFCILSSYRVYDSFFF